MVLVLLQVERCRIQILIQISTLVMRRRPPTIY